LPVINSISRQLYLWYLPATSGFPQIARDSSNSMFTQRVTSWFIQVTQYSKWAGICRYSILELLFVPEFHTGTYQYIYIYIYICIISIYKPFIYLFSNFLAVFPFFAFKKRTGTSISNPTNTEVAYLVLSSGVKSGTVDRLGMWV
jgi:hypothetical protein